MPLEGSISCGSGCSHSASPDIVLLQSDDDETAVGGEEDADHSDGEETLSQGTVSLLNISASDNEDARKAIVHEAVHKSNIQYGNWQDEQIHQGKEGIAQCNKGVNNYTDGRKPCKAPEKISPPISYMEERGVFRPLDTIGSLPVLSHQSTTFQHCHQSEVCSQCFQGLNGYWRRQKTLGGLLPS